jgi:hypothetical protein
MERVIAVGGAGADYTQKFGLRAAKSVVPGGAAYYVGRNPKPNQSRVTKKGEYDAG